MVLIDTHTHAIASNTARYPQRDSQLANGAWWVGGDFSADRLRSQVADSSVDGVVLVQAAGPYGDDNRYLVTASDYDLFGGVCIVDPTAPNASGQLTALSERSGIDGIRLFHVPTPTDPWLAAPAADTLIDRAAELGLTVTVCCMADSLGLLGRQLQRRPDVSFVLDHCGFADFSGELPFAEAQPLWDLASHKNLHVKFTPTLVKQNGVDPAALAEAVVERFGSTRVVWGSDWPQHRETTTYAEQVDLVQSWFLGFDDETRSAIGGENALRLWPRSWPHLVNP